MPLFVICIYFVISLICSKMGYSETYVIVTTTGTTSDAKDQFATMVLNKTETENTSKINTNDSHIGHINLTSAHSHVKINVNGNDSGKIKSSSEFENSTDDDESDTDNVHSSFNLAIIPGTAVFVLMIFICFKCCKWFRKYTRGDDKDVNYYAVILTDDDDGHVPIDAISSNTSLLKSSDNENFPNSYRDSRTANRSKNHLNPTSRRVDDNVIENKKIKPKASESTDESCFTNYSTPNAILNKNEPISKINRNNKLSVSFSVGSTLSECQTRDSLALSNQPINVRCSVRKSITKQCDTNSKQAKVMTNSVSTQTNKSFRLKLRASKGHLSESDMNQNNMCNPTDSQTSRVKGVIENGVEGKIKNDILIVRSNSKSVNHENNSSITNVGTISKYPIDTNIELIENVIITEVEKDSDSVDDVFVDATKRNSIHSNDDKSKFDSKHVLETCKSDKSGKK